MSAKLHQKRGGELAALVNRYFAQVDAFNSFEGDRTDEEANTTAAATYEAHACANDWCLGTQRGRCTGGIRVFAERRR
jgi:hypothetical protein